jgi:hypothetical protein
MRVLEHNLQEVRIVIQVLESTLVLREIYRVQEVFQVAPVQEVVLLGQVREEIVEDNDMLF